MTSIFINIQQLLDSNNINGAREEVRKILSSLKVLDANSQDFIAVVALGSQTALEISLGVFARQIRSEEVNIDIIWLVLAATLSRQNITPSSVSRISILGIISYVKNWKLPIFALLTPALDSFFKVSLSEGSSLITEQTLDFIATWGDSYAKAPRTKKQIKAIYSLAYLVLNKVDDLEVKEEWSEGLETFSEIAYKENKKKYSDERIWSAGYDLLKKVYDPNILNKDRKVSEFFRVKNNILRLITSSLAAIGTIVSDDSLSIAVRVSEYGNKQFWSTTANTIDKVEHLFQEIADVTFSSANSLPKFMPAQAIPGSWTIILHINLNSNQSTSLAKAISCLSLEKNEKIKHKSSLDESWQNFVKNLQENNIKVDLAVSANNPELEFSNSISTEDFKGPLQHNIRVLSRDVPQADSLERVLDFALLLIQYSESSSTIQEKFLEPGGITKRQVSFYKRAVEILGLMDEQGRPTNSCFILNYLKTKRAKKRFLGYRFMSSNIGTAWFEWQSINNISDIQYEKLVEFLTEVSPSLSETTIKRRAHTLESWLEEFLNYLD
jgi:hypothetical protein